MTVGQIIKRERLAKGLSMRAFAKKADVSLATIFNTESGKHVPTNSTLKSLAEALDMKTSDILLEAVADVVKTLDKTKEGAWYG